jgi:hypothetical protein
MLLDYVCVDTHLPFHRKIINRPDDISEADFLAAMGIWVLALAHVGRTTGHVTRGHFRLLTREPGECTRYIDILVRSGFMDPDGEGWRLRNVDRYQAPRQTVSGGVDEAGRPVGPKTNAQRKREYDARKRAERLAADLATDAVTSVQNAPVTESNESTVTVTPKKRREEKSNEEERGGTVTETVHAREPSSPLSESDRAPITAAPSAVRPVIDRDPPPLSSRPVDPMIGGMFSEAVRAVTGAAHVITNSFAWRDLGQALYAHFPDLTGGQHGAELRRLVPEWIADDRAGDGFAGKHGYQPKPFINWLNARAASESAPEPPSRYKPIVPRKLDGPVVPPTEEFLATLEAMERGR